MLRVERREMWVFLGLMLNYLKHWWATTSLHHFHHFATQV